ncbi:thiamine phosphate synthase [Nigerium massiliense]|uniref:thiamine phosphate synthase n=1 Tax=Nigerium massiliense TaxID=1522317 RepID=UPI00058E7ADA|nr:thiamine phosphate synthase [Nigerium massiliense]
MGLSEGIDYRVYLVTSGGGDRTVEVAAAAARGGAGVVQVRLKDASSAERFDLLARVAEAVAAARPSTRVLVDDDVDAAKRAMDDGLPVHGVHLGRDDLPVREARALLGPTAVIGWTTGTLALVEEANEVADVIDYVGAGPFRPTPTKDSGRPPLGLAGYPALVAIARMPIVAIGDVRPEDVPALSATGVAGVAMVRSIMAADDPEGLVRRCLESWSAATAQSS